MECFAEIKKMDDKVKMVQKHLEIVSQTNHRMRDPQGKIECFVEIKKMVDKVKMAEKHLEIVSQTNQRMKDLQSKIEYVEEWRNKENNVPSSVPVIKSYDISVHTLATTKC